MLRGEAQQFPIERRINQVKAALCDAIKRRSQGLVTTLTPNRFKNFWKD
jgi:hypothetical protein